MTDRQDGTREGLSPEVLDAAAESIVRKMLLEEVRLGLIDTRGKTDREIADEFASGLIAWLQSSREDDDMRYVIDHTRDLLQEARRYRDAKNMEFAALMYATWAEHWINQVVASLCYQKGFEDSETQQLIRDTHLSARLTWVLKLLGAEPIDERHRGAVIDLMNWRNNFVHYKWIKRVPDVVAEAREAVARRVLSFEATVSYLQEYEDQHTLQEMTQRADALLPMIWEEIHRAREATSNLP